MALALARSTSSPPAQGGRELRKPNEPRAQKRDRSTDFGTFAFYGNGVRYLLPFCSSFLWLRGSRGVRRLSRRTVFRPLSGSH